MILNFHKMKWHYRLEERKSVRKGEREGEEGKIVEEDREQGGKGEREREKREEEKERKDKIWNGERGRKLMTKERKKGKMRRGEERVKRKTSRKRNTDREKEGRRRETRRGTSGAKQKPESDGGCIPRPLPSRAGRWRAGVALPLAAPAPGAWPPLVIPFVVEWNRHDYILSLRQCDTRSQRTKACAPAPCTLFLTDSHSSRGFTSCS